MQDDVDAILSAVLIVPFLSGEVRMWYVHASATLNIERCDLFGVRCSVHLIRETRS